MSSRKLYARFFAMIYDPFMHSIERRVLSHHRKELLSGLHGRIIEIGAGSGVNLSFYVTSTVNEIIAVEPNRHLWQRAEEKLKQLAEALHIRPLHAGIEEPSVGEAIADESIDAVVCTLVLCTIPHPQQTIDRIYRWLKPGGRLVVLEHIRSHRRSTAFFQDLFTPAWRLVADGCHLNRATDVALSRSGLLLEDESHFKYMLPLYRAVYTKGPTPTKTGP
jgi:ubiquinone/menaquinone biosynthesis C-methylase UbiE